MLGAAQELFIKKGGMLFVEEPVWPFLQKLVSLNILPYIDFAIAERLLREKKAPESIAAFLCYLSLAMRSGHLCVEISGQNPDPLKIIAVSLDQESENIFSKEQAFFWKELIYCGVKELNNYSDLPITILNDKIYFNKLFKIETDILFHFYRLQKMSPKIPISHSYLSNHLTLYLIEKKLLLEQKEAIENASMNSLTLICGGPGTGKTYTAGNLIKLFLESLPEDRRKAFEIVLAAPTGKATANLYQSLLLAIKDVSLSTSIKKMTLHSLLNVRGTKRVEDPVTKILTADLLIIDESSMIDAQLMKYLLESIKPGARLVFLGDPFQLPPVGVGMLFSDMVEACKGLKSFIELKKCVRTELKQIIDLAEAVKVGDWLKTMSLLEQGECISLEFIEKQKSNIELIKRFKMQFTFSSEDIENPSKLFQNFSSFRLLSSLRRGAWGVETLNHLFLMELQKTCQTKLFAAPIMVIQNDSRMELANGEVGVLVRKLQGGELLQKGDYALFQRKNEEGEIEVRRIPALLLPRFEYAYCISIHKSQGSEFDHAVVLIPPGGEVFGREILYTGITRARKKLEVWADISSLKSVILQPSFRLSGFVSRYQDLNEDRNKEK